MSKKFIMDILNEKYGDFANDIFNHSHLLQYIERKTRSVNSSSKARGSFANLYAIYVLCEDYLNKGFANNGNYSEYEGMKFTDAFNRQRELPFGQKLQNHALNHRCNEEFHKYYPEEVVPIIRDLTTKRYWISEDLLNINIDGNIINIAQTVLDIIDMYVYLKRADFESFINECLDLKNNFSKDRKIILAFLEKQLSPNVDARIFELVSYVILKYSYQDQVVFIGASMDSIQAQSLNLFKTGRTNANDGGIDFVMRPIGRFFQVTEVLDFKKYFLDIDKISRFPITFVVKIDQTPAEVLQYIKETAEKEYPVDVVDKYLNCFEEIITIPTLLRRAEELLDSNKLVQLLDDLIIQCQVEYNFEQDFDEEDDDD